MCLLKKKFIGFSFSNHTFSSSTLFSSLLALPLYVQDFYLDFYFIFFVIKSLFCYFDILFPFFVCLLIHALLSSPITIWCPHVPWRTHVFRSFINNSDQFQNRPQNTLNIYFYIINSKLFHFIDHVKQTYIFVLKYFFIIKLLCFNHHLSSFFFNLQTSFYFYYQSQTI